MEKIAMPGDRNGKTCSFDVCSQCKLNCCQGANPPLTLKRQKIITDYMKEQKLPAKNAFTCEEYSHPTADAEGICAFFSKETGKCLVHQVKPETCRAGPFTFDINHHTRRVEWYLKKSEICALAQRLHENDDPFKMHFEVAKAEIMRLICELDADALKAILKIPEPQTFKIGDSELPTEVMAKLGIN